MKFINDIEDLGDISADASAKLASYVSEFGRLEQLFKLPDQPEDSLPVTAVGSLYYPVPSEPADAKIL